MDNPSENVNANNGKNGCENMLTRQNMYLLVSVVALGVLFDTLFYGKPLGVSYPLFVAAFYLVFFWNTRRRLKVRLNFGWCMIIPVLLLSLTYMLFDNMLFRVLNFLAVPILIVMQTTIVTENENNKWYSIKFATDILNGFLYRPFVYFTKPFKIISRVITTKTGMKKDSIYIKIVIGIAVSVPLVFVIVALLASADQVFKHFIGEIPNLFQNISIGKFTARFLLAAFITVLSFSYILSLTSPKPAGYLIKSLTAKKGGSGKLDPVIIITVLTVINIIYVFFVFIQFSYLFGSINHALPQEFTYAEYARRGFFELIFVTMINFSILLVSLHFGGKRGKRVNLVAQVLNSLLVACTLVMLFSAHFRMSLYEAEFGYTYLRVLSHGFMIFLFVIFVITLYGIWKQHVRILKPYVVTAIAAFIIINYFNIDVYIARKNIDRYYETGKLDVGYLTTLSYDAIPDIVPLLEIDDKKVSERIGDYMQTVREELDEDAPWQSFNISRYRAGKILSKPESESGGN